MNKEYNDVRSKVRHLLSDFLGVEPDDVEDDFSLTEDLHMKPTDITDFMETLNKNEFETEKLDLTAIETFSDLIEAITEQ